MLAGLAVLLGFQVIGEIVARSLAVPLPGPVLGMVLLAIALVVARKRWPGREAPVEQTSNVMIASLGIFFVPAGVGVLQQWDVVARFGLSAAVVLLLSTLVTLAATVAAFLLARRLMESRSGQ